MFQTSGGPCDKGVNGKMQIIQACIVYSAPAGHMERSNANSAAGSQLSLKNRQGSETIKVCVGMQDYGNWMTCYSSTV